MRVAAVDIGTNTVRALVADEARELDRFEFITGLGVGVDATGRLSEDAIDRTAEALRQTLARIGEVSVLRVVATSASRDAQNREAFFDRVERAVGERPELLSGDEEASLSFAGATARRHPGVSTVVDLGGGSTEIISGIVEPTFAGSFDIGSVRISDRHFDRRPVPDGRLREARQDVRSIVTELPDTIGTVVGVGGAFQTMGLMLAGDNDGITIERSELDVLVARLARMTIEETADLQGVSAGREEVILGGALIAATVLDLLGSDDVCVSRHDLLDGMVALLLAQSHSR